MASALCSVSAHHVATAHTALTVNLAQVSRIDLVGIAALLQVVQRMRVEAIPVRVTANDMVRRALVDAHLADTIRLHAPVAEPAAPLEAPAHAEYVARSERVALRTVRADDLGLFAQWARDPELEHLVGSDLLYRCRHLGSTHPSVRDALLTSATALTLLVEPRGCDPIGYVRLFNVQLDDGFAFLETAVTEARYRWGAWGLEATHLFLVFALDALGLHRVEAKAFADNRLSCNTLRRRGFRLEGTLKEAHVADGRRIDIALFALVGDDMRARRRRDRLPYMGYWPPPATVATSVIADA